MAPRMNSDEARRLLGLRPGASETETETAFRRLARSAHPDAGGDAETFAELVAARKRLMHTSGSSTVIVVKGSWWRRLLRRRAHRRGRNLR